MLKPIHMLAVLVSTIGLLGLLGCDAAAPSVAAAAEISVDELAKKLDHGVTVFDANGADTHKEFGTIPGAVLLTNSESYDTNLLPKDKAGEVVFYCSSEMCSAAPKAAERAITEGHTNVKVLKAGIKGWTKAGKAVEKAG